MIEQLIGSGYYKFTGTVRDLKKHFGGFRITEVLTDGNIQGVNIYSALAEFRYRGKKHRIAITSDFSNDEILHLEYRGGRHYE